MNLKREKSGVNFNNDLNTFIEYYNSLDDILSDIEDYNKKRKRQVLMIFDDMISHVYQIKKYNKSLKIYLLDAEN